MGRIREMERRRRGERERERHESVAKTRGTENQFYE